MATNDAVKAEPDAANATADYVLVGEGLTKVFYPEASNTVIFVIMAIVLMLRPQGLFGTPR